MNHEKILVLDFGGQYNQLIARRVRDEGVYAEVYSSDIGIEKIKELSPKGIIFTGGPQSVYKEESQHIGKEIFELGIPIFGFCYGAQLIAYELGGEVATAPCQANMERRKPMWRSPLCFSPMYRRRPPFSCPTPTILPRCRRALPLPPIPSMSCCGNGRWEETDLCGAVPPGGTA